jgi:hypothetical protein
MENFRESRKTSKISDNPSQAGLIDPISSCGPQLPALDELPILSEM